MSGNETWWQKFRRWFNLKYRYICCDIHMEPQGNGKYKCHECGKVGCTGL